MLNFKIIDGVLQDIPSKNILIGNDNNLIRVLSNTSSLSPVYLIISGFLQNYRVPLFYNDKTETSNVFSNYLIFSKEHIAYMKNHPNKVYNCSFQIDNVKVDGSFNIILPFPNNILTPSDQQDKIIELYNKYNELYALLNSRMYNLINFNPQSNSLQKGTVPVATGYGDTYVWDFPKLIIKDLIDKITVLSEICKDLSEQNKRLTNKVSELENKINNHIYEQYEL